MRFDDGPTDGQSHAGALGLGGVEGIKDGLRNLWRQSYARISYRNQNLSGLVPLRADGKFTTSRDVLHGLDAVEHQVHEYLLQLDTVGDDLGNIVGEVGANRNRVSSGLVAQKNDHFPNELIYINQFPLRRDLLEQQADPLNDFF